MEREIDFPEAAYVERIERCVFAEPYGGYDNFAVMEFEPSARPIAFQPSLNLVRSKKFREYHGIDAGMCEKGLHGLFHIFHGIDTRYGAPGAKLFGKLGGYDVLLFPRGHADEEVAVGNPRTIQCLGRDSLPDASHYVKPGVKFRKPLFVNSYYHYILVFRG